MPDSSAQSELSGPLQRLQRDLAVAGLNPDQAEKVGCAILNFVRDAVLVELRATAHLLGWHIELRRP